MTPNLSRFSQTFYILSSPHLWGFCHILHFDSFTKFFDTLEALCANVIIMMPDRGDSCYALDTAALPTVKSGFSRGAPRLALQRHNQVVGVVTLLGSPKLN